MTWVCVTTDDVCPENNVLWHYWDKLKRQHPRLKVTCFVPGMFHGKKENNIYKSKEFRDWHKERSDWVEIAAHGLTHTHPPEFTKFKAHQEKIVKKMSIKLRKYLPVDPGFKAPFNRYNHQTIEIIKEAGYSYFMINQTSATFLVPMSRKPRPKIMILQSHTNAVDKVGLKKKKFANTDNINLIAHILHKRLKLFEKRRFTYETIGSYVSRYKE